MKLREVWVVAGTDNAGIWQAFVKQGVETRLAGIVERGGGLIHEQPLRFVKQRARKRDALLFSSRQHLLPILFFVQPSAWEPAAFHVPPIWSAPNEFHPEDLFPSGLWQGVCHPL